MMQDLLLIGTFPALAQNLIGTEFRCHPLAAIEHDDALRTSIRAVITRSNYAVLASVIERLPNLGIVGLGRIGKEIARRLEPFGVALSYYGRTGQKLDYRFQPDLHELARASDILIVTSPGGRETEHMIDASVLEALGAEGYLLNIARGSVVHQEQLIEALAHGVIAGAALDVFDGEPDIDPRFFTLDNVVLSPHSGSATNETRLAMARMTLDNLHHFFKDGTALTPVVA